MANVELYQGDCLEVMSTLPAQSVEAIITDLPYGTTACSWDEVIPFGPMWEAVKHVLKPRGVFVTTASQPFTSRLIMSNLEWFKYEIIYEKTNAKGFLSAKFRPLTAHENIIVFGEDAITYNPQMWVIPEYLRTKRKHATHHTAGEVYGSVQIKRWDDDGSRYPTSVIGFSNRVGRDGNFHPTQKPVSLYEYLVCTYTNPGDTVLDMCAGGGTTGIASIETGRNAILIEKDPEYFSVIQKRIQQAQAQPLLFEQLEG
jgi:site-specific DNA-methyltransferase (adenine-specific)